MRRREVGEATFDGIVCLIVEPPHECIPSLRIGGEVRVDALDVVTDDVVAEVILLHDEWWGRHRRYTYACFFPHPHG